MLETIELAPRVRKNCLKLLYRMCARHSLLPGSLQIEVCYNSAATPHSRGGFADVWRGEYDGLEVAVKVLRTDMRSDLQKIARVSCPQRYAFACIC